MSRKVNDVILCFYCRLQTPLYLHSGSLSRANRPTNITVSPTPRGLYGLKHLSLFVHSHDHNNLLRASQTLHLQ